MNNFFSEHIITALCDALLYSLGLGIALAVTTGTIILLTRKASAKLRYNLLVTALALFAGAVIFSFFKQLLITYPAPQFYNNSTSAIPVISGVSPVAGPVNDYTGITGFFRLHANTIVLLWLLIVVIKAFQLTMDLQSLSLLKRNKISSAGENLEEHVRLLSKKLGIQRVVRIAASGIAKVPMVIGHLKPVILLPIGLVTSLSPENIEAILVHELAHIRRRDWLVNLLVSTLEVIFFFNPAVLWISSLIRTERENCCDDIAVRYTGSKISYIDTLVACQEFQQSSPAYSLAFSTQKKPLLARVKRMISNKNSSLNRAERGIMAVSLVITLIGIVVISSGYKKQNGSASLPSYTTVSESIPANKISFHTVSDSITSNNDSLSLSVDSLAFLTLPDRPVRTIPDSMMSVIDFSKTNQATHLPPIHSDFTIYHPNEVDYPTDVTIPNADVLSRLVRLDSMLYQVNSQSGKVTSLQVNGNTVTPAQQLYYLDKLSSLTNTTTTYTPPQAYIDQYKAYQQKCQSYDDETNLNRLVASLIAANVIHHKDELLSFKLSDTEFIMNDIKMPDAVYLPLRKAFVQIPANGKKGSWAWMYNFKTS